MSAEEQYPAANSAFNFIFEKEPLRDGEKIITFWDGSVSIPLTIGMLLTNQAIINWDKHKIERFNFNEMADITIDESSKHVVVLKFRYKNENRTLFVWTQDSFSNAVLKAISDVSGLKAISSASELSKKNAEYVPLSKAVNVPIVDNKIAVSFPNKCIYCGGYAETNKDIAVRMFEEKTYRGRGTSIIRKKITHSINISVPYCRNHAVLSDQNANTLNRLFLIGMLIAVLPTLFIIFSQMTFSDFFSRLFHSPAEFVFGLTVIFLPLAVIGLIMAWLPKLFPFLFKNKTLRDQPWFLFSHGGALGIRNNFIGDRSGLSIKFANPELAQEFAQLNSAKTK